jgi:1-deoxy-D-xylulose-5-phosphate reductoisomerase
MRESTGIAVLGSTGSVGRNTLDVVRHLDGSHRIVALAAGRNADALMEQIREFRPSVVSLDDPGAAGAIRESAGRLGTRVLSGMEGATAVATAPEAGLVVSAIVGSAGLVPTHAAVAEGCTVALANKEVMVVGGAAIRAAARRSGAELLPVDSEHNALHQCLRAGRPAEVRRLILTASGGPFWERRGPSFESITVAEALAHPVWDMGPKITIDSATMMNKGLEVIEARWLFDLPPERIEILVHPGSVVHSLVEFADGSILAQLGVADMRQPIQYALTWPERRPTPVKPLDLASLPALRFFRPEPVRFPCPSLAYRALELGGVAAAALNGANEALVGAFLAEEIGFMDLPRRLARVLDEVEAGAAPGERQSTPDLTTCLAADAWARERALASQPAPAPSAGGVSI